MMISGSLLNLPFIAQIILVKVPNIIVPSARESADQHVLEMSGRGTLIRPQVVFFAATMRLY